MTLIDLSRLDVAPAGFGRCPSCAYRDSDSAPICYSCARQTHAELTPGPDRCAVCDLPLNPEENDCGNPVCKMGQRWFDWNWSITYRRGVIERAINAYKYEDQRAWRMIFGRIVVGFLDDKDGVFDRFDAIIPSPTFVGPEEGARSWDHTAAVLGSAAQLSPNWPIRLTEPQLVIKTKVTPRMVGNPYRQRRQIAEGELRESLQVTDAAFVTSREVLVYDDVFTDGLTLREVARALRRAGAARVCGISLTRQPYRG